MVDIVHHAVVGVAGAVAANALGHSDFGIAFAVGSLAPDLDVLFVALGRSRFLRLHQGATHSFLGMALISALSAALLFLGTGGGYFELLAGFLAGMAIHVGLDLLNTFGVMLLWPISSRRICADAFFFIDVWVLLASVLTLAGLLLGCPPMASIAGWVSFVAGYAALRTIGRLAIRRRFGTETEVPSGVHPLRWFVTRSGRDDGFVNKECVWTSTVDLPAFREHGALWYRTPNHSLLEQLRTGPLYRDLEASLRRFMPVKIERIGSQEIVVLSRCVAVPNFGNRYGETVSEIHSGKVVHETARI